MGGGENVVALCQIVSRQREGRLTKRNRSGIGQRDRAEHGFTLLEGDLVAYNSLRRIKGHLDLRGRCLGQVVSVGRSRIAGFHQIQGHRSSR